MEVSKGLEQLCHFIEHFVFGDTFLLLSLLLNPLEQVTTLTQFHHDAHLLLCSAALFVYKVIFYLDDVRMFDRFHQPHFSLIHVLIRVIDDLALFECENLAILDSSCLPNQSKTCSVQQSANLVLFV